MNTFEVLILGANSDIAIATATNLAQKGYNLQLASRSLDELKKTAADISIRYNVKISTFYFDATDFSSHKNFYESIEQKPEGVIVAFGIMHDQKEAESNYDLAKQMLETNYLGSVSILEIIASDFEKRNKGFIVGISSVAGDRGRKSNYLYGSSKAAFTTYLQGLSHRLAASNVPVHIVKPGFVDTKMTTNLDLPGPLTAQPSEVAKAVWKGINKNKQTIYVKGIWRYIMLLIIHIPSRLFKKLNI